MKVPRARLTSNGKIKVKFPGRKSRLFKVPFYDRHRRKALRSLRYVFKRMNFKVTKEEAVRRIVDLEVDGERLRAQLIDHSLIARFSPTEEILKYYPGLNDREYEAAFLYEGVGLFKLAFSCDNDEEYDALKGFLREVLKPLYDFAFLNDATLKRLDRLAYEEEVLEPEEPKPEEEKPPKVEVKVERHTQKRARRKRRKKPKAEPSIEELKSMLGGYKPGSFRERVAFSRYREALEASPDDEDELHRLFYKLINTKDYEVFYRQLYTIVPKLHRKVEHGVV